MSNPNLTIDACETSTTSARLLGGTEADVMPFVRESAGAWIPRQYVGRLAALFILFCTVEKSRSAQTSPRPLPSGPPPFVCFHPLDVVRRVLQSPSGCVFPGMSPHPLAARSALTEVSTAVAFLSQVPYAPCFCPAA